MGAKGTAHEMIQDLFRVRQELGRAPSRIEYTEKYGRFPGLSITETFGSFALFLKTAGIEYIKGKKDKQELRKQHHESLKKQVEEKRLKLVEPPPLARNLLVFPDLHAPFNHPDAIPFLESLHKKYKFDTVISTGDEVDLHAFSFHDHDPDSLSPGHELDAAIKTLEPLYKLFPNVLLAESNHGSLVHRRAKHFGLPRHVIKSYREILQAPEGWEWHFEVSVQMTNGKRLIVHHSYSSSVLRASQHRGVSIICGHHHSQFGVQWWRNYDDLYFAGFAGSLVDETALAMEYGKNTMQRPILGAIGVFDGVPREFPMLLDRMGRWTGKLP